MKTKLLTVLFGSIWVATTQSGSAALILNQPTLIAAFSEFTPQVTNEGPEYQIPGVFGDLNKNGTATFNTGGSSDDAFTDNGVGIGLGVPPIPDGIVNFPPVFPVPGTNNGYLAIAPGSSMNFKVVNFSFGNSLTLAELLFDSASTQGGQSFGITYSYNNSPFAPLANTSSAGFLSSGGSSSNYNDFVVNLLNFNMGFTAGNTIEFVFTNTGTVTSFIDNVALVAVPEPSSVLALGCLLGSGVFLRQRRRVSATLPQTA